MKSRFSDKFSHVVNWSRWHTTKVDAASGIEEKKPRKGAGVGKYGSLYTYLQARYADVVVLTFVDIEALLGFSLPDVARRQAEW